MAIWLSKSGVRDASFLAAAALLLAGCVSRSEGPAKVTNEGKPVIHQPRLWFDKEVAMLLKRHGGHAEVNVIRWKQGYVEGFLELEIDGATKRVEITDYSKTSSSEPVNGKGRPPNTGMILLILDKTGPPMADRQDYRVSMVMSLTADGITAFGPSVEGDQRFIESTTEITRLTRTSDDLIEHVKINESSPQQVGAEKLPSSPGQVWFQVRFTPSGS